MPLAVELAEVVHEAVKIAGRFDLRFEMHEPRSFKDGNDQLRCKLSVCFRAASRQEPSVE
jgi:hypothetical protein